MSKEPKFDATDSVGAHAHDLRELGMDGPTSVRIFGHDWTDPPSGERKPRIPMDVFKQSPDAAQRDAIERERGRLEALQVTNAQQECAVALEDFYAYMPTHQYLFAPTRDLWPATSVNARLGKVGEEGLRASEWLDRHRPIEQMTWHPAEPQLIRDRVLQVAGWALHEGATVFNLYRPPLPLLGDPSKAGPWVEHLRRIYPDDARHIELWLAHRLQRPGDKINHALVFGGAPGIGKDTLLEPIKVGVGPWNCQEVSPAQMLGRFNGWAKAVVVRVSEARDLGEVDRFAFYDHSKVYMAAPPDVVRVDEKNLREHYVVNVCGVIITTNHKTDGLYLPADDRRHYVAWSEAGREDFEPDYWQQLYGWYATGGVGHVAAYLRSLDLADFDAKAPPPKTPAFWAIVAAGEAPESAELRDVLDRAGNPQAITLAQVVHAASELGLYDLAAELRERKNRRSVPHKLERVGYVPVRNPDAEDGLFKVAGRRQAVYAQRQLSVAAQVKAARMVS